MISEIRVAGRNSSGAADVVGNIHLISDVASLWVHWMVCSLGLLKVSGSLNNEALILVIYTYHSSPIYTFSEVSYLCVKWCGVVASSLLCNVSASIASGFVSLGAGTTGPRQFVAPSQWQDERFHDGNFCLACWMIPGRLTPYNTSHATLLF